LVRGAGGIGDPTAGAAGEKEQRLYGLVAWHATPYYRERERAALAWTEALTSIADNHVPDKLYEQTRREFTEQELVDLTLAVTTINAWNRINISFRAEPGTNPPPAHQ
jgi:alkylhydroperoxidase family enzyme